MTRYARALGSKGANAKVPETATPWSDMGVVKVERPDDIEVKNDPPKEKKVVKPKKKVVKLAAPAANVQKPVKSTKSIISSPLEVKIEKSVTEVLENTTEKPSADTTSGTESVKTNKKRNKINTKDGTSSGKKMKVTLDQDQTGGAEAQNKKSEGKETEKSDNNSTKTKGKKGEKKKKLKKKNSVKNVNPADSLAENSTEDVQANVNGSSLGNMKKNAKNQANENVLKAKGNQRKSFEKPVGKIVSNSRDFQKPVAHLYDSEKEALNKLAIQKMNEERFLKVRQNLINSGASQDEVERKMYRIRRSVWKKLFVTICRRCRKRGHVLKDCPETATNSNTKCYKCGETDHTSKMCSIKQEVYTFADCFICHQTGHLTRTCPNNTRGIYPKGGCCHYCSEVTHLARDCPKKYNKEGTDNQEDEDVSKIKPIAVTLDVNQSGDADVSEHQAPKPIKSKGKRVVKF